jgi:hypothetical protein
LQLSVHWELQLDPHRAAQPSPLRLDMHPDWQSRVHCSSQVNVDGMVVHAVFHLV